MQDDVSRAAGPPPRSWDAAVAFHLGESTRVEFFDGEWTRLVAAGDTVAGAFGRSPWFRLRARDAFSTTVRVTVEFPGNGNTVADYPLTIQRGVFPEVTAMRMLDNPNRVLVSAQDARSYPVPTAAQKTPADSLWIFWSARSRQCWDCPN
ncbi:MAG TPA: hypothetical protein VFJ16_27800 [Longimicrobium sp.]|nr:hypothetical protein [Longimicrobium sp.]